MSKTEAPQAESPVLDYLRHLHRTHAGVKTGSVATYIPELAKANPDWFGICVVTANGSIYEVGDSRQLFTIQSISKPFVYGLALEDNGRDHVLKKVGVEPTGDAFNSISLDPGTGRPRNPMINAGAIASAGLIAGKTPAGRFKRVMEAFNIYAGRALDIDKSVYDSESETGHRNRAIGHMLRNFDILETEPTPIVDLYFKQCSIAVNCRDLGIMAATLANRGINPVTGKQAIRGEYVESVLSVMGSCGMYDYAGEWIYNVGMPAKSGVAGGIIAVLPGQLGIGIFSPPLDPRGNSVRGIQVCDAISRNLDLHLFNRPGMGKAVIRLRFTAAERNSSCVRSAAEKDLLRSHGDSVVAAQLQGNLTFATAETVLQEVLPRLGRTTCLALDFKRVLSINESACRLFFDLHQRMEREGRKLAWVGLSHVPLLNRYIKLKLGKPSPELTHVFPDIDQALEWAENVLLDSLIPGRNLSHPAEPADYELFHSLTPAECGVLSSLFKRRTWKKGETLIEVGDPAGELFFLCFGKVSVLLVQPDGSTKRLATFSSGMAFGEMAAIDRAPRSARIVADTDVQCDLLQLSDFDALGKTHPSIKIQLLENLGRSLSGKLRKANRELSLLD